MDRRGQPREELRQPGDPGELRYTDHGSSKRTVRFEEVAVTVPVDLDNGEVGVGVSVVWRP